MILRRAVRVGQDRPQAELLLQILRRIVVFLHIVRQAQGFRPAGEDVGLRAGQVDCDLLVGFAVGVSVAIDAQGVSAGDLLRQANAVAEGRTGVQRPAVVFNLHIRIAQQVQSRGCLPVLKLEIVGVEAAGQAVCDHADGVAAGCRSGEADRQPRPAAVNAGGGLDIQLFGRPCRPGGRGHFQIDAVSEEAGGRGGLDVAGEGVSPSGGKVVRLETRSHCGVCRGRANEALLAGACARAACAERTAAGLERPCGRGGFKAAVFQQVGLHRAESRGAQGAVVRFVGCACAGIDCGGGAEDVVVGVGRVGVDGSACVVKNICSQDVVAAFRAVSAVVAVDCAAVLRVRNRHDCTGLGGR